MYGVPEKDLRLQIDTEKISANYTHAVPRRLTCTLLFESLIPHAARAE